MYLKSERLTIHIFEKTRSTQSPMCLNGRIGNKLTQLVLIHFPVLRGFAPSRYDRRFLIR